MTNPETQSDDCAQTNNGDHQFAPCSCCMALAQVRMGIAYPQSGHNGHGANGNGNGFGNGNGAGTGSGFGDSGGGGNSSGGNWNSANARGKKPVKRLTFQLPGFSAKKAGFSDKRSGDGPARFGSSHSEGTAANQADGDAGEAGVAGDVGEAAAKATASETSEEHWQDDLGLPKNRKLWQGLDGKAVMLFGVLVPLMVGVAGCLSAPKRITLLLLNHPLETTAELLLIASIPLTILSIWSSLCKNNIKYTLARGIALGAAIGSAFVIAGVCVAALFHGSAALETSIGTDFTMGFCWIAFLASGAAAVAVYLVNRMRLARDFSASRMQVIAFSVVGLVLSIIAFIGAEARPWCIRLAEMKAVSTQAEERNSGLRELRALLPERELRMECSDERAAGLAGLFLPLKPSSERELYFAVTGKPYSFREENTKDISFMPDDDLRRRIVGDKVSGLSLIRSTLDGVVHPQTLSSTLNWTFVFKNSTTSAQEMRAEIGVPPGAVIDGLSVWRQGERQEASVAAAGKAEGYTDSNWTQVSHDSPAIISDLGHGRMLLHCYPVSQEEELKVAIKMVVPLKPDGSKAATLNLPSFIATNFETKGFNHSLKLRSPGMLSSTLKNFSRATSGGLKTLEGAYTDQQIESSSLNVAVARNELSTPIVVLDKTASAIAQYEEKKRVERIQREREATAAQAERQIIVMIDGSKGVNGQLADINKALDGKPAGRINHKPIIKTVPRRYIVQTVTRVAAPAPKHLVVVIDGSETVKKYADELSTALAKLPSGIPTDVIIASQEQEKYSKAMPFAQALAELKKTDFVGGQNNLQSVINAAELAGDRKGGAVLWIHGPQPSLNEEIYIMSQYTATPDFYELQVGSGDTDTFDFFKNHSEIGPFSQVPRNTNSLTSDLAAFFSKWRPDSNDYALSLVQTTKLPTEKATVSELESQELVALSANREIANLIATKHFRKAARLAIAYGLVTPVSCALIMNNPAQAEEPADDAASADAANADSFGDARQPQLSTAAKACESGSTLQGATNGTISPQGADGSVVMGVNTAGTVRVNNLANLEAFLNIIANLAEIGCAIAGFVITVHGFARREPWVTEVMGTEVEISAGQRIVFGVCLVMLGLAVPGVINWFVASARDAALFN